MDAHRDFASIPAFEIRFPSIHSVPFIFNSPHSGRYYPERFLRQSRLDCEQIRRSEDAYVDQLFDCAVELGAPLLTANFPRAYLDVNREPFELDPRMFKGPLPPHANTRSVRVAGGLGTVPRIVGEGLEIYAGQLPLSEAIGRIEKAYVPYHACLKDLLRRTVDRFGQAVLIDCHSMPASIRVADSGRRPDFIIGDRYGTSASRVLSDLALRNLSGMGYFVTYNKPYAGGFITEYYGQPFQAMHALQIEVNRGLYMNETSYEKSIGFEPLRQDIRRFCASLLQFPESELRTIAAE